LRDQRGASRAVAVRPLDPRARVSMMRAFDGTKVPPPLWRRRPGLPYWVEYQANENIIYFQYRACVDLPGYPFEETRTDLEDLLGEHKSAALVIDLRDNSGGDSSILDRLIDSLKNNPEVNRRGRLFVLTGRNTFSSAILNAARLRTETQAVFVGEPTGGAPNHFGEIRAFELPNSRIRVWYSTKYFRYSDENVNAIVPDVLAEPTFSDYRNGTDAVLEAVIAYRAAHRD